MEKKYNIIRSAIAQSPVPKLSDDFTRRLMERVHRESKRREQHQMWLLFTIGIGCLIALGAGVIWYFDLDFTLSWHLFGHLSLAENTPLIRQYIFIAFSFLGLLGIDHFLRRRRHDPVEKTGDHKL